MPYLLSLNGPPTRTEPGRDRLSILIPSAPKSLNSLVENGPAPAQVKSAKRIPLRKSALSILRSRRFHAAERREHVIGILAEARRSAVDAPHRLRQPIGRTRKRDFAAQRRDVNFPEIAAEHKLRILR